MTTHLSVRALHSGRLDMRLVRVGKVGKERPAVLIDGDTLVEVGDLVHDFDSAFFAAGGPSKIAAEVTRRVADGMVSAIGDQRLGAPIARPHQILCIGLNYPTKAEEARISILAEPTVISKSPNTLVGPSDYIVRPPWSTMLDYEVELGVVIGSRCQYLSSHEQALASIAGFVLVNDVSDREVQFRGEGQGLKGKSSATFNPCGPYLVTPDEIGDLESVEMWLEVNGERRQQGSTADMVFSVATIIQYLSRFFVLEPGDLINTGTPPGVAFAMENSTYLTPGDVVSLGATRLGTQRTPVVAYMPSPLVS